MVAIKTDKSVTFVHTVRVNNLEANLGARPDKIWTFLFFNNVFSGILLFYIIVNSSKPEFQAVFLKTPAGELNRKQIRLDFEET